MEEKIELTKKFKLVDMYHAGISTDEMPIIGTQALATCVGVLVYSPESKRTIVAHASTEYYPIVMQILDLIFGNGLENSTFKYLIIPGYYENHYNVYESLEQAFQSLAPMFEPFSAGELSLEGIVKAPDLPAYEFAFDSLSGKFVSDKVYFGKEYNEVHEIISKQDRR